MTVTRRARSRTHTAICAFVTRAGDNSAPELDFLANSGIGIGFELAYSSLSGIEIELGLPSFEFELELDLELRSTELSKSSIWTLFCTDETTPSCRITNYEIVHTYLIS